MDPTIESYIRQSKVKLHSNINKIFTKELLLELETLALNVTIDNNSKIEVCKEILTKHRVDFSTLGGGTNRFGILIDGDAYKIAMDRDGIIDNKREFIYSKAAQPYVIKVYECESHGLIMCCEYITVFNLDDYYSYQNEMKSILKELSKIFFIGDIGIDPKNYYNWGIRIDGSICILDFAYIYKQSFKTITCPCGSLELLSYDKDYNLLICPACGEKHTFWELRKRITKKQQDEEIGDITKKGYVIKGFAVDDVQDLNIEFTDVPKKYRPKPEKIKKPKKVDKRKYDEDFLMLVDKICSEES